MPDTQDTNSPQRLAHEKAKEEAIPLYFEDAAYQWHERPPTWITPWTMHTVRDVLESSCIDKKGVTDKDEIDRRDRRTAMARRVREEIPVEFRDECARRMKEVRKQPLKDRLFAEDKALAADINTFIEILSLARMKPDTPEFEAEKIKVMSDLNMDEGNLERETERVRTRLATQKKKKKQGAGSSGDSANEWANGLYHIKYLNRIGRPGVKTLWTMENFNAQFGIHRPIPPGWEKSVEPSTYVKQYVGFKATVDNAAYAAGLPEIFSFNGKTFLNQYDPADAPPVAEEYTEEGAAYVKTIRDHILCLVGWNKDYAWIIESWIALNVRSPGEIIGWAILVKGVPGDGKTMIFDTMMGSVLGEANVGQVSHKEIATNFNAWAYGKAYRHMPELKAVGGSRYEVEDVLKPHVTDGKVRMIGKGDNGDEVPNRTNYTGTTNHENALPLSDEDRRWFIIFAIWKSLAEMAEALSYGLVQPPLLPTGPVDLDEYFTRLKKAVNECGPWMRKYLMEMELHPAVRHGSRAQDTIYKTRMIKAEFDFSGGDEFESYIEGGSYGISRAVVMLKVLGAKLIHDLGSNVPRQQKQVELLKSRGFFKVERIIKWRTMTKSGIYVSDKGLAARANAEDNAALDEIRRLLDATVPKDFVEACHFDPMKSEDIKKFEEFFINQLKSKKGDF